MRAQATWLQRIAHTQAIMSAAWQMLKQDKTLLLLPLASSACLMLLTASFAVPAIIATLTGASLPGDVRQSEALSYIGIFVFNGTSHSVGTVWEYRHRLPY